MPRVVRAVAVVCGAVLTLSACTSSDSSERAGPPSDLTMLEQADWSEYFDEHAAVGTFVLHQIGSDEVLAYGTERARTPQLPASTFKVLNSLIALDTNTVSSVDEVVPWDGVARQVDAWNQDHSLRTGIEVSAVWMYQELARQIGSDRMADAVAEAGYGNADIGGPIDEFWLRGDLRISPVEQLDVLSDLLADDLPFDEEHQAAVREIMIRESGDDWVWGHKTGTALTAQPVLGWLVGYTVRGDEEWVFAMNLDLGDGTQADSQIDPQARLDISRAILVASGALPPEAL